MAETGAKPKMIKCDMVEEGQKCNFASDLLFECPLNAIPFNSTLGLDKVPNSIKFKPKEKGKIKINYPILFFVSKNLAPSKN